MALSTNCSKVHLEKIWKIWNFLNYQFFLSFFLKFLKSLNWNYFLMMYLCTTYTPFSLVCILHYVTLKAVSRVTLYRQMMMLLETITMMLMLLLQVMRLGSGSDHNTISHRQEQRQVNIFILWPVQNMFITLTSWSTVKKFIFTPILSYPHFNMNFFRPIYDHLVIIYNLTSILFSDFFIKNSFLNNLKPKWMLLERKCNLWRYI